MNKIQTISIFNNDVEHQQDIKLISSLISYFKECVDIQIEVYIKYKNSIIEIKKIMQDKLYASIESVDTISNVLSKANLKLSKYSYIQKNSSVSIVNNESEENKRLDEYYVLLSDGQKEKYELDETIKKYCLQDYDSYRDRINKLFSIIDLHSSNHITNSININTCHAHIKNYDELISKVNKLLEKNTEKIIINVLQSYINNIINESKSDAIKLFSDLALKVRLENKLKSLLDKKVEKKMMYITNEKLEKFSDEDQQNTNDVIRIISYKNKNPKTLVSTSDKQKIEKVRNNEIRLILIENYYKAINGGLDIIISKFILDIK